MGSEWYRNPAVCTSELGWKLSGFARVVYVVAVKRAKLWLKGSADWHAGFFVSSSRMGCGWALRSASLLEKWCITDWPQWVSPGSTVASYKDYVWNILANTCQSSWWSVARRHRAQVPYSQFVTKGGESLHVWRTLPLPATALLRMRSWCRFRCGLFDLRHLGGRNSDAEYQKCIFCDADVRNATVHCLSLCGHWATNRVDLVRCLGVAPEAGNQEFALAALGCLDLDALVVLIHWAAEMDYAASAFWSTR